MTAPTNGHGHGHDETAQQPFLPDAHFAVQAQQEEIEQLRAELKQASDRKVYLRAVILQVQAEAQHQASLHLGEIENYKVEIEALRRQLFASQNAAGGDEATEGSEGTPVVVDAPQGTPEGSEREEEHAS